MSRLNNADFRSILNDLALTKKPGSRKTSSTSNNREKHKQRYLQIQRRQKLKAQEVKEEKPTFRDRAEERRKQIGEYAHVAEEFNSLKARSVEESKFLGGDIEHTHLVKGLDYVLLNKVRWEIDKLKDESEQLASRGSTGVSTLAPGTVIQVAKAVSGASSSDSASLLTHGSSSADDWRTFLRSGGKQQHTQQQQPEGQTLLGRRIVQELALQLHPHHILFKKKLDRVHAVVGRGAQFRGNTRNFHPGRMTYEFDTTTPGSLIDEDNDLMLMDEPSDNEDRIPSTGCSTWNDRVTSIADEQGATTVGEHQKQTPEWSPQSGLRRRALSRSVDVPFVIVYQSEDTSVEDTQPAQAGDANSSSATTVGGAGRHQQGRAKVVLPVPDKILSHLNDVFSWHSSHGAIGSCNKRRRKEEQSAGSKADGLLPAAVDL